jgi:hypothetical protein
MLLEVFFWEAWLLKGSKNGIKKKKFEVGMPMLLELLLGSLAIEGFKKRN